MNLPRYPKHKDCGVGWLGELPALARAERRAHMDAFSAEYVWLIGFRILKLCASLRTSVRSH
jgi:hypothetical protein